MVKVTQDPPDGSKRRLWGLVEDRFDELVQACAELIEIPSPTPPGDTRAIADHVRRILAAAGLDVEMFAPHEERPSIVATLGQEDGAHLLVNGHLDHFPPAADAWTRPPFQAVVEDDRLYGLGVTDMRAGLATSIFLARLLVDEDISLSGRLTLVYSSDEEAGGRWGTEWLLDNVPSLRADACLVGDQCGTDVVGAAEKGLCWFRVTTSGHRSHGAYGSSESAIRELNEVLSVLYSMEELESPLPEGLGTRAEDPLELVRRVSVNVGTVRGGESPNLVADSATADIDIRVPVGLSVGSVMDELAARLDRAGCGARVDRLYESDPTFTHPTEPIVRVTSANAEAVLGRPARPIVRVGASDARLFRRHGIPSVVYGPAPGPLGGGDEFVELDELKRVALVHAGVIADLLGLEGPA